MPINLIAAIGRSGQLGFRGHMPWHNTADLAFFRKATLGGLLIVGKRTFDLLPPLPEREVACYHTRPLDRIQPAGPDKLLLMCKVAFPDRQIWIAGGARTYRDFAPFVDGAIVFSFINYDGPADTFFPFDAYGIKW
jgi:dihydrofolate reductase